MGHPLVQFVELGVVCSVFQVTPSYLLNQCVPVGHLPTSLWGFGGVRATCSSGTLTCPVLGVWVVCGVFQWDTHLSSLWSWGGVQCVLVGHPLVQFWGIGWCAVCSSGTPTCPVCGVGVVCSVFQWNTHLSRFWGFGWCAVCSSGTPTCPVCGVGVVCSVFQCGMHPFVQFVELGWCALCSSGTPTCLVCGVFGGVQCIPVGHPFNQEVWDQLTLSCFQSACLAHLFACFCLTPSSSIKKGADQLYSPVGNDTRSLCVCLWSQNGVMQHDTKLYKATAVPR